MIGGGSLSVIKVMAYRSNSMSPVWTYFKRYILLTTYGDGSWFKTPCAYHFFSKNYKTPSNRLPLDCIVFVWQIFHCHIVEEIDRLTAFTLRDGARCA